VLNQNRGGHETAELVRGQFQNGDAATGEVLLVAEVLVRGQEEVEVLPGKIQQLTILDAFPTQLLRGAAFMAGEPPVQRPWHALVEEDRHAAGWSTAACEWSSMRTAISRVTVGKHSMNSASE